MTLRKEFRNLEKRLVALGFEYDHTNASSQYVYVHETHPDLAINPTLSDNAARQIVRKVERALGCAKKAPKRDAVAVKARQSVERDQRRAYHARLYKTRIDMVEQRMGLLDGAGEHVTNAELRDLERRVRQIEMEQRELEQLMTERPNTGRDSQRAKHRSGER